MSSTIEEIIPRGTHRGLMTAEHSSAKKAYYRYLLCGGTILGDVFPSLRLMIGKNQRTLLEQYAGSQATDPRSTGFVEATLIAILHRPSIKLPSPTTAANTFLNPICLFSSSSNATNCDFILLMDGIICRGYAGDIERN